MKYLVLTDIHGNLPALEAVLATPRARDCDAVLSLGDHTGFGPCPRQVQQRLESLDATMLRGNHEDRLCRADAPDFAGYNWALLHWTKAQMAGMQLDFPLDKQIGSVLLTHGAPGDPFHLMKPAELPALLKVLPQDITLLVSGHSHTPWYVTAFGRSACNPGALGMVEDEVGKHAPFAVLTVDAGMSSITGYSTPYDVDALRRAYVESGCADVAPEMCRMALFTMETGSAQAMLKFMSHALRIADAMALPLGERAVWEEAARTWSWRENMSCAAYWRMIGGRGA